MEGGSMIKKSESKFIDPRKLDFNHMFTKKNLASKNRTHYN
jgi:hypothetical protein